MPKDTLIDSMLALMLLVYLEWGIFPLARFLVCWNLLSTPLGGGTPDLKPKVAGRFALGAFWDLGPSISITDQSLRNL